MKFIKLLHTALGIIPFVWFISFLIILIIGTVHFGCIPKYGNPIDPYALGVDWISIVEALFSVLGIISFFLWPLLTIILYVFFRNKMVMNKLSIILFIVGIVGFFLFRYVFTDVFMWVVD